jgi:hypothetical protein
MLGILTNDPDDSVSFDNLTFVTDRLYAGTDFHPSTPFNILENHEQTLIRPDFDASVNPGNGPL